VISNIQHGGGGHLENSQKKYMRSGTTDFDAILHNDSSSASKMSRIQKSKMAAAVSLKSNNRNRCTNFDKI